MEPGCAASPLQHATEQEGTRSMFGRTSRLRHKRHCYIAKEGWKVLPTLSKVGKSDGSLIGMA